MSWRPAVARSSLGVLVTLLVVALALPASGSAAAPDFLFQIPSDPTPGPGAGQLVNPRDVVGNSDNGHIYVSEALNKRISEFTAWGTFVRAWGWDVAPEGAPGDTLADQFEICTASCQEGMEGDREGQFFRPFGLTRDSAGNLYVSDRETFRIQKFSETGEFLLAFGYDVVAEGPNDHTNQEVQQLTVDAGGGAFALDFRGRSTGAIGFGRYEADSTTVTDVTVEQGTFKVGGEIVGPFIPPGTTITAVGPGTLSLSQPTTAKNFGTRLRETDIPYDASAATVETKLNALSSISAAGGSVSVSGGPGDEKGTTPYVIEFEDRFVGDDAPTIETFSSLSGSGASLSVTTLTDGGGPEICKAAGAEVCKTGVPGDQPYQLAATVGNYIAFNPTTNSIFVGDTDMIQEFDLDGNFTASIPFEGDLEAFDGKSVTSLESDASGNLYISLSGLDNVHRLSPTGALLPPTFAVKSPSALALDSGGSLFAIESRASVLGFTGTGAPIAGMTAADQFAKPSGAINSLGLGTNLCAGSEAPGRLYISGFASESYAAIRAYGTPPIGCEPPPLKAPEITAQYATSVGVEEANVRAEVNPNFWTDTTYHVQYGPQACLDSGWTEGCHSNPLPPGSTLTSKVTNQAVTSAGVQLTDLEPRTIYHYRFVAQSTGSAGQPVIGVGGEVGSPGESATFRTFARPEVSVDDCANAVLRTGPSAELPNCRAYEMVSPLDKNDGDIHVMQAIQLWPNSLVQASEAGTGLTYSAITAFADPQSAPVSSQYLGRREGQAGWATRAISPPANRPIGGLVLETEFKAFSPDLCTGWLRNAFDPPLAFGAVPGHHNLYRADYCGAGGSTALTTVEPEVASPSLYTSLALQGISADGSQAVYLAPDNLTEDAPANSDNRPQLYHWHDDQLRYVCFRPNGIPSPESCVAAGADGAEFGQDKRGNYADALSADGSRLYWSEGPPIGNTQMAPVRLFVRENPGSEQSAIEGGQCTEPEQACTYPVSAPVSPEPAEFWGASEDGSRALFTIRSGPLAGNLYLFDLDRAKAGESATSLLAAKVSGVLGASEDLSRIYFLSREDLDEGGPALPDQPNLYLRQTSPGGSEVSLAAALSPLDLVSLSGVTSPGPVALRPLQRSSRVSADGTRAVFISRGSLTGYDNRSLGNPPIASGNRSFEVYLYDALAGELVCISCNPSGARPSNTGNTLPYLGYKDIYWATGWIPGWERSLYPSRVLSDDGRRLFFHSFEALVPEDTNGMQDVYQWEQAGKGSCDEADPTFNPDNGGCVELISSGTSDRDSSFVDASASGDDVFFTTLSSLVPPDYGLVDIYDARVGGGLTYPEPPRQCEGEACQSPPPAPDDPTPASSSFNGAGNVDQPKTCAKGMVLRKGRCVARKCGKGRVRRKGRCVKRDVNGNSQGRRSADRKAG